MFLLLAVSANRIKIIYTKRCKIALYADLFIPLKIFNTSFRKYCTLSIRHLVQVESASASDSLWIRHLMERVLYLRKLVLKNLSGIN